MFAKRPYSPIPVCPAGFFLSAARGCVQCPVNTYSSSADAASCAPCPENLVTVPGRVSSGEEHCGEYRGGSALGRSTAVSTWGGSAQGWSTAVSTKKSQLRVGALL